MVDPIYAHPRLAALYDVFDGGRDDLAPYLALAEDLRARRVVDLGCGTGALSVRLAAAGRQVVGIDPAEASLGVARGRPDAERVTWLHGDASVVPADPPADLVVMTGNAAQAVVPDDAWAGLLRHVRAGLTPGGSFAFETRRPDRRAWEDWGHVTVRTVPGEGPVEERLEVTAVELPLVSFRHTYRFADGTVVGSDSTIRFRDRPEVEADLARHGFAVTDVRDAPDRPGREWVFVASVPRR